MAFVKDRALLHYGLWGSHLKQNRDRNSSGTWVPAGIGYIVGTQVYFLKGELCEREFFELILAKVTDPELDGRIDRGV